MASKMAMYTVRGFDAPPDIAEIADILKVEVDDIDASFGVKVIDPRQGLYCVMADENKVPAAFGKTKRYEGPWSTPGIERTTHENDNES